MLRFKMNLNQMLVLVGILQICSMKRKFKSVVHSSCLHYNMNVLRKLSNLKTSQMQYVYEKDLKF